MNSTWDLTILYQGFDDAAFAVDKAALGKALEDIVALADGAENMNSPELINKYVKVSERMLELATKLIVYSNLRYSANTKDNEASSNMGMLMGMLSSTAAPQAKISKIIASCENLEQIINSNPELHEFRYLLKQSIGSRNTSFYIF